jgi:cytoskeletal protein CcmA (bactofilin family)
MFAKKVDDKPSKPFIQMTDAKPPKPYAVANQMQAPPPLQSSHGDGTVIIGRGTRIVGDLFDCQTIEIQGAVEGRIVTTTLIVREGGNVSGQVQAETAEIHGRIEGSIEVRSTLDVRGTGRVLGEISYGKLAVAMGGHVFGNMKTSEPHDGQLSNGMAATQMLNATYTAIPANN